MIRVVQLSDLHFGREKTSLIEPLFRNVEEARPSLIVVTGDLVQRARAGLFRQAVEFLDRFSAPWMAVPGNHDIPLYNLPMRVLAPYRVFSRGVTDDLQPVVELGDLRFFGVNSAYPARWRRGIARASEIDRVCEAARTGGRGRMNILVFHHPMQEPPGFQKGETLGAPDALQKLAEAGVSIIMSGHLHHYTSGLGITAETPQPILQLQGATALCGRHGEFHHGFSVIDFDGDRLTVTPWFADPAEDDFLAHPSEHFVRADGLWHVSMIAG